MCSAYRILKRWCFWAAWLLLVLNGWILVDFIFEIKMFKDVSIKIGYYLLPSFSSILVFWLFYFGYLGKLNLESKKADLCAAMVIFSLMWISLICHIIHKGIKVVTGVF